MYNHYEHAQKLISLVIPESVKLAININHHIKYQEVQHIGKWNLWSYTSMRDTTYIQNGQSIVFMHVSKLEITH